MSFLIIIIAFVTLYCKKKKLTTAWRNLYLFFVNSFWFMFLMFIFGFESRFSYRRSATNLIVQEYIQKQKSFSTVWNELFQQGKNINYGIIFIGFCVAVFITAFIDYKSLNKYCYLKSVQNGKVFYNLQTSKTVLDSIISVTTLAAVFVVVLYGAVEKKSIPKDPNFASYIQYLFQIYLIPLLCVVNYLIAKLK